ncbi:TPA: phage protein NinX family protein [Proteus mirabilis]
MNKYTELSDLEINKRVFVAAKIEHEDTDLHSNKVFYGDGAKWIEFNPCDKPSDAMTIIIENGIAMNPKDDIWQCGSGWNVAGNKNPYRAAMEVFLMIKDAENED